MNPIDANTLTNVTPLSDDEFNALMTTEFKRSFLKKMPTHQEARQGEKPFDVIHVVEDVYLARGKISDSVNLVSSCSGCAMQNYPCSIHINSRYATQLREIPCVANFTDEHEGYVAIRAQIVSLPTNGKKHKKEYIPDSPENFDFSPESWKSVKTMIGL